MKDLTVLEEELRAALADIRPGDKMEEEKALRHWDAVAKPLHGLGQLEGVVARMAAVAPLRREYRKCVAAFCADNGVVAEGVTQTDSSVTAVVAKNMLTGDSSVCCMGRVTGADVIPVDAGMLVEVPGMQCIKVARGTKNLAHEPAMTRQEALSVLLAGMDVARQLRDHGGQDAAGEILPAQTVHPQQVIDHGSILICTALRLGGELCSYPQRLSLEHPQRHIGVPDVDGQQHTPSSFLFCSISVPQPSPQHNAYFARFLRVHLLFSCSIRIKSCRFPFFLKGTQPLQKIFHFFAISS